LRNERRTVAATLALLAFLLTFTFSTAASRFETRRLDEANAIGTTYLRAGLLPAPHGSEIQRLLRDYIETRIAGANPDQTAAAITKSEALQTQLWSHANEVVALDSHSMMAGLFIQAWNQTIDLHATRIHVLIRVFSAVTKGPHSRRRFPPPTSRAA
jgi:hypothetical protein